MLGLLLALCIGGADAQPAGSASVQAKVQTGEDLAAWRAVDCQDPNELRQYIQEFPTSPLAELALRELEKLDESPPVINPVGRVLLESSLKRHDDALNREATAVYAAPLAMGELTNSRKLIRPALELGWTTGMQVYVSGGLKRGRASLALRSVASAHEPMALDVSLRMSHWTRSVSPYAEIIGHLRSPALGVAVGLAHPLERQLAVTVAVESTLLGEPPTAAIRVGLIKVF